MRSKRGLLTACLSVFALTIAAGAGVRTQNAAQADGADATYLAYGASWKYESGYVEDFPTLGLADGVATDDLRTGNAPFGFAGYGQYDFTGGTEFILATDKQQTYHVFTTTFTVNEVKNALKFDMLYDDGIAVYLDGTEVYRDNLVGYDFTRVENGDGVENSVGAAEETSFYLALAPEYFTENSVHTVTAITVQDFRNGNDAYFDMRIGGVDGFTVSESDMPDTVALTYYDDPFTSRGIAFYTGLSLRHADVRYREAGTEAWSYVGSDGEIWYGRVSQKVALTGLKEGEEYEYALGNKTLGVWGDTFTFETTSSAAADESFKFSYITDTQSSDAWQFSIWQQLAEYIEANGETFDFLVHGGDIVESSVSAEKVVEEQWRVGFNALQSTMTAQPMVPVAGNHEYAAYAFYRHFNIDYADFDECGAYYSFDYGNAHFTVVNTNQSYFKKMDDQLSWLEKDLADTDKTWKIVLMHFSAVTDTAEGTSEYNNVVKPVQEKLMPLYAKYEVDLVLQGHTHRYFRSAIYGHGDSLAGETTEETMLNLKNSVVTDATTYTDLVDGTIYTVNPDGTMYVTAKSSNYNVYYQNCSWNPNASTPAVFATNPLNGKLMNGGSSEDDTSYLMNYMQYVSVEVGKDTLKCNVYNVNASTGETTLWDTYNVLKTDGTTLDRRIGALPDTETLSGGDLPELLKVYGLYAGLGTTGLSDGSVTKIEALKEAVSVDEAKALIALNERIAALTAEDTEEFLACDRAYAETDDDLKKLVDTANLEALRADVTAAVEKLADQAAAGEVIAAFEKADKIVLRLLTQEDIDGAEAQYNALTVSQKELVTNAKVIDALKAKLKAAEVVEQIAALQIAPVKTEVDKAYEAYSELSAEEKTYVENYELLDALRRAYRLQEEALSETNDGGVVEPIHIALICAGAVLIVAGAVAVVLITKKRGRK